MFRRPTSPGERSAEERVRAAAERAARRAAREGGPAVPPPPETFDAGGPPPDPSPNGHEEPVAAESRAEEPPVQGPPASEPAPEQPPGPVPEPVAAEPEREPLAAQPEPEPAPEPVAAEPEPEPEPTPEPVAAGPEPEPEPTPEPVAAEPEPTPVAVAAEPEPDHAAAPAAPEPIAEQQTVEWSPPPASPSAPASQAAAPGPTPEPAPQPEAPLDPLPPPVVPRTAPKRGRWRRQRGSDPLVPTRTLNSANRSRGFRRVLAVVALLVIAAALYLINATFQPFHGDGRGAVRVTVPSGADVGEIGRILADRGVVDSPRFFSLNATLTGRRGGLRPGTYTLPRDMSYGAAIDALVQGPAVEAVKTFDLSLPEGRSARETAAGLEDTSIEGEYVAATRGEGALRRARALGLPRSAETLEGYLYPATYELPEGTTARELVGRQLDGFRDNTAKVSYARAKRLDLSRYDVLTIASMIEREAQLDSERRLVSSVIYNRLEQGIPLGIDATIRYSTGNWSRPIRQSELEKDGPYNSRTRRGLPPTPIGNPGLASIRAAANPRNTSYLYYVVKPGSNGAHAFSRTDAEFQRDVARYQASREANGGQAP